MSHPEQDQPVPAVVRRARRAMVVMIGGLAALGGVLVYVMASRPASRSAPPPEHALELPPDARIVSTALDGDRIALTVETEGRQAILVLRLSDGRLVARIDVRPAPPAPRPVAEAR